MLKVPKTAPWMIQQHNGDSRRIVIVGKDGMIADVDWSNSKDNALHATVIQRAPAMLQAIRRFLLARDEEEKHHAIVAMEESVA